MEIEALTLSSNLIYLICSFFLFRRGIIFEGSMFIIAFIVSYIYHTNINSKLWRNIDISMAIVGALYLVIRYNKKVFHKENLLYLLLLMLTYWIGFGCYYIKGCGQMLYCFIHSIWHILSGLYALYIIMS